jgi:hypothetical protein
MSRPILLNSCALASTAAEARYRIQARPQTPRASRVVGLDPGAAGVVRQLSARPWHAATFFQAGVPAGQRADLVLDNGRGRVLLRDELRDADFVLMIATGDEGAAAASAIGNACLERGIMTAGIVLGGDPARAAVTALRPYARVLLVTEDPEDIVEIMSAVGA